MQGRILAMTMLALTGCAATGEPVLNSTPVDVTQDELDDYWVPTDTSGVFVKADRSRQTPCGVVDYRMLIDSNGEVHDFEVIDSEPKRSFERAARAQAEARSYVPAEQNAAATPVRLHTYVTFDNDPADDIDCSALARELLSRAE
jgi:TonB family protein